MGNYPLIRSPFHTCSFNIFQQRAAGTSAELQRVLKQRASFVPDVPRHSTDVFFGSNPICNPLFCRIISIFVNFYLTAKPLQLRSELLRRRMGPFLELNAILHTLNGAHATPGGGLEGNNPPPPKTRQNTQTFATSPHQDTSRM